LVCLCGVLCLLTIGPTAVYHSVMAKFRSTSPVRMRKPTLDRLRALGRIEREDLVDLLDVAVVLLEMEIAKGRVVAERARTPDPVFQPTLSLELTVPAAPPALTLKPRLINMEAS